MSGIRQIVPVPDGGRRFRAYNAKHLDALTTRAGLGEAERLAVRAVGTVLPFRTNAYVIDELIDWTMAPDDPVYRRRPDRGVAGPGRARRGGHGGRA